MTWCRSLRFSLLATLSLPLPATALSAQTASAYDTVALSPPDLDLSYVSSLAVDSHGRVYLADAGRRKVTVLGPDASPLMDIGREGSGPGEFRNVSSVEILPGDSLLVYDGQLARLTLFPPGSATPTRTLGILAGGGGRPMWARAVPDGGYIAGYAHSFVAGKPQESDNDRWFVLALLSATGTVVRDSLLVLRGPAALVMRQGGRVSAADDPFGLDAIVRTRLDRLLYVDTDSLAVRVYTLAGTRVATVHLQAKRIPLSRHIVDSIASQGGPLYRQAVRQAAPATWRPIRDFVVDDQDRLWVGLVGQPLKTVHWQVVGLVGRPSATVSLPWDYQIMEIQRGLVYGVVKDADDVPRVLILRAPR
jgi:hypothetical protein